MSPAALDRDGRSTSTPEFSRPFPLERLADEPRRIALEANAAERQALARRFDLERLDRLTAELTVAWARGRHVIEVCGRLHAEATQRCVVTLFPVPVWMDVPFVQRYILRRDGAEPEAQAVVLDPEREDPPEPIGAGGLDLGEAVAQELAIALDPYPRAPGAVMADTAFGADAGTVENPFAVLKNITGSPSS